MNRTLLFALPALALFLVPAAHAQTVITGHHDGNSAGNGYNANNTTYVVPADTGTTPNATFNGNLFNGLTAFRSTLTVAGGQFNNNGYQGVDASSSTVIITGGQFIGHASDGRSTSGVRFAGSDTGTISGGTFSNSVSDVDAENSSMVTVSGGTFTNAIDYGISSFTGSDVSVTGGLFSGNAYDFETSNLDTIDFPIGAIDIYGSFLNPATGQPLLLGQTYSLSGSGRFTGTLQNNTVAQTYSYNSENAAISAITLHNTGLVAAAPEPSSVAALSAGILGLGALSLRARRRSAA